jgi:hypothetical protein
MDHFFNDIWTMAQQASPFATALVLYIWYAERAERKETSKRAFETMKASHEAMKDFRESIDRLSGALRDLQFLIQTKQSLGRRD